MTFFINAFIVTLSKISFGNVSNVSEKNFIFNSLSFENQKSVLWKLMIDTFRKKMLTGFFLWKKNVLYIWENGRMWKSYLEFDNMFVCSDFVLWKLNCNCIQVSNSPQNFPNWEYSPIPVKYSKVFNVHRNQFQEFWELLTHDNEKRFSSHYFKMIIVWKRLF